MKPLEFFQLVLMSFLIFSCSSDDAENNQDNNDPNPDDPSGPVVYVTGKAGNPTGADLMIWENGEPFSFYTHENNSGWGDAISIFVSDQYQYVAGYTQYENYALAPGPAVTWARSGDSVIERYLGGSGEFHAEALDVFVTENEDVYVAGFEEEIVNNWPEPVAKVWKNGQVLYTLTSGSQYDKASEIVVANGNVYVAGTKRGPWGDPVPVVWVNGESEHQLYTPEIEGNVSGMVISGDDVYISGNAVQGDQDLIVYWKNNSYNLVDTGSGETRSSSIAVSGETVYIGGYKSNGAVVNAKIWTTNGEMAVDFEGSVYSGVEDIFVYGSDIYACGSIQQAQNNYQGVVWKNGSIFQVLEGESHLYISPNSVFVK